MAIFNQARLGYWLRAHSSTYVKLCLVMCGGSVDGCGRKREPRPRRSFHLMLQGLNCHFRAGMLILSSKQSLAILSCVDLSRKHADLSAKDSCLLTKS